MGVGLFEAMEMIENVTDQRASYRRHPRPTAIVTGILVAVIATLSTSPPVSAQEGDQWIPSQPLVEGRRVFDEKHCSHCHGIPGSASAARIGPDLGGQRTWQDVMQLSGSLWNHAPGMIEKMRQQQLDRPKLSPEEMSKLGAYLFYVDFIDEPGDAERGRQLFEQRSCARCHQLGGRGGTVGPRLDELKAYASSVFLAQALWNHGPEMATKMTELSVGRPHLGGNDVADIVAFIRAGAQTAAPLETGSPIAGKALFREKGCIKCHAIAGAGGTVGPDLGKQSGMRHVTQMAGALWNHGPSMWTKMTELSLPFPKLTDRDMSDLLAYLYFVQYMGGSGDAAKGSTLFREKTCSQCHAVGRKGEKAGIDLALANALQSPVHWAAAMWNHAPAIEKALQRTQTPWPRFADDEMRDLVEFLRLPGDSK